ncbi:unnamed protein product [Vitrella brassicaformis CCMP3155]|uniref:IGFBP N-terminal domain-containing protein n=1 Tax=Vitrella brassicaformis (strain CCMP3155) TaxID=1169540 RepID=A0A0G4G9Q9_VITBC|nr:unnamed protein product [Vitrella brassicaformis CCMP3155]|eukprot:CEM25258.1 unnamed protein product [Vitrella brassicaformis CCMP3155]
MKNHISSLVSRCCLPVLLLVVCSSHVVSSAEVLDCGRVPPQCDDCTSMCDLSAPQPTPPLPAFLHPCYAHPECRECIGYAPCLELYADPDLVFDDMASPIQAATSIEIDTYTHTFTDSVRRQRRERMLQQRDEGFDVTSPPPSGVLPAPGGGGSSTFADNGEWTVVGEGQGGAGDSAGDRGDERVSAPMSSGSNSNATNDAPSRQGRPAATGGAAEGEIGPPAAAEGPRPPVEDRPHDASYCIGMPRECQLRCSQCHRAPPVICPDKCREDPCDRYLMCGLAETSATGPMAMTGPHDCGEGTVCSYGLVCCNRSLGICVPPGELCYVGPAAAAQRRLLRQAGSSDENTHGGSIGE